MASKDKRIAELEDALKDAKRRNDDMRREINDQNKLITELRENCGDLRETIQNFKDVFDLGTWDRAGHRLRRPARRQVQ